MQWRKSSSCNTDAGGAGDCIEVQAMNGAKGALFLRNSKRPDEEIVATPAEFRAFLDGVRNGDFDDLT